MKRCSTCNRTYDDPNLSFCIDDGTPLTPIAADDDTTVVRPRNTEDNDWNAAAYQPPRSYVPPGTEPKRRRALPWVLGIVGAFILGILALSVAAAILIPRMMRSQRNERAGINTNQAENSNVATESNSNSNANEDVDTPPPTDHEQVLGQLTTIEQEWTVANINADKKASIEFWLMISSVRVRRISPKLKPITFAPSNVIRAPRSGNSAT